MGSLAAISAQPTGSTKRILLLSATSITRPGQLLAIDERLNAACQACGAPG